VPPCPSLGSASEPEQNRTTSFRVFSNIFTCPAGIAFRHDAFAPFYILYCAVPLGAVLYSSNEPGELSQWLCYDDSTINIVLDIIIMYYYLICSFIRKFVQCGIGL